jgi:hypothetical protein
MVTSSTLTSFLRAEKNSRPREFLLTCRVIHDLMVAAATRNYDLLVYTPTVDSDGFDIILDDRDRFLPLQIKSVMTGGRTAQWAIHRKLLRPEIHEIEWFGFEPSSCGEGRGGGVLLVEVTPHEYTMDVTYLYTDLRILTAYCLDLISISAASKKRLSMLRSELAAASGGKVNVPRSAFLKARSPEHLLALAGLHSRYTNSWPHLLYELARHRYERRRLHASEKTVRAMVQKDLEALAVRR